MQTRMKWMLVVAAAVVAAACGDSMSSLNPTAPSALSPATLKVEANAADVPAGSMGNGPRPGNGSGNGNGNGNGNQPRTDPTSPAQAKVELEGSIQAKGVSSITVNNQEAVVTAATVIRHGDRQIPLAALAIGDRVHVSANRVAGVSTLEAVEILVQNPGAGEVEPPPAPLPVVSVVALDANAAEDGSNPGAFRFTRTGDLSSQLTVAFAMSGTATNGSDYQNLQTATFLASLPTVDVTLTPLADNLVEGAESAVLTLTPAAHYQLGAQAAATVNIADHVVPAGPVVTVLATDPQANEEMTLFGVFELRRTGDLTTSLTVTVSFAGGSAAPGEYQGSESTTVTFDPFQATTTVLIVAMPDGETEAAETVILTVVDGAGYDPGTPATATVTIPANSQ